MPTDRERKRDCTAQAARLLTAKAMGLVDVDAVDDMFPDLFDLDHDTVFEEMCARVEQHFGLGQFTADELVEVWSFDQFVDLIEAKLGRPVPSSRNEDAG